MDAGPSPLDVESHRGAPVGPNCANCGAVFEADFQAFVRALAMGLEQIECPKCARPVRFWQRLVDAMEFGVFGNRYAAVGANVLWLTAKIDRGEKRLLHFVELGIPEDASVERVYVTPQGSPDEGVLVPVFFRDPLVGHPAQQPLLMTSMPISGNPASVTFSCLIVWTPGGARQPASDLLLAAVRRLRRTRIASAQSSQRTRRPRSR